MVASFPGLPCFYLTFGSTIIHGSRIFANLLIPCIIVNANGRSKGGRRPGTKEAWDKGYKNGVLDPPFNLQTPLSSLRVERGVHSQGYCIE